MDVVRLFLASVVGGILFYSIEGRWGKKALAVLLFVISLLINTGCIFKYLCPPVPKDIIVICPPLPVIPYLLATSYTFLVLILFYIIFTGVKDYLPFQETIKYVVALLITLLLFQLTLEVFPWLALSSWRFC